MRTSSTDKEVYSFSQKRYNQNLRLGYNFSRVGFSLPSFLTMFVSPKRSDIGRGACATICLAIFSTAFTCFGNPPEYAGSEICAQCHREIAVTQAQTAMANTWRGALPASSRGWPHLQKLEGTNPQITYQVQQQGERLTYSTTIDAATQATVPVEVIVGGKRNGMSFLERIDQLDSIPLARPAMIEARYAYHAKEGKLVLSPGFDAQAPTSLGDALGQVLSPAFEQKCLACHGQAETPGSFAKGGVGCEGCHGPSREHVASVTKGAAGKPAILPVRLAGETELNACARCHSGLSDRSDPIPSDLLVSNQVPALRNSECFLQSGQGLSCTSCHDPHRDSTRVAERSVGTCRGCHSLNVARHASICPVNATSGCVGCHMPSINKNSFQMTDHWIRVHPEQNVKAAVKQDAAWRSQVVPKSEFLRLLVVDDRQRAEAAAARLAQGERFRQVAHDISADPTAPGGGFVGSTELSQMEPKLGEAAAKLAYGETSGIVDIGSRRFILHRLSRDFKWDAEQLFEQGVALKARHDLKGAIEKDRAALEIYPYFLRALVLMGTTIGESGDAARAEDVLRFSVQFYPDDPEAQFDLGLTLSHQPAEQIEAFRRAIDLNPDLIAPYESLGAALYSAGRQREAMETFRRGLQIDPLSALLNYDLSLALSLAGDEGGAKRLLALATKLDPGVVQNRLERK